jgi:plasmid stabilization system protein ParE
MYTVIFSKRADKDIISIVKHVAAENPEAAKKTWLKPSLPSVES